MSFGIKKHKIVILKHFQKHTHIQVCLHTVLMVLIVHCAARLILKREIGINILWELSIIV